VASLQTQLDEQIRRHELSADKLATLVKSVLNSLSEDISSRLDVIMGEIVEKKIEERVRLQVCALRFCWTIVTSQTCHQLNDQIPEEMLPQSLELKRQILEVQASLHNSWVSHRPIAFKY
jgi:hypothetical protein